MSKIQVYHFHNGHEGGVLSVIRNLLQFSSNSLIENHIIHTINKDLVKEYPLKNIRGAVTERIFYYSGRWNFYYTCRQLAKLLPDKKAVVVAHDWLELGMMSNLGLQNPVVQFVHGAYDYYYQLARAHGSSIDLFITVAKNIETKLLQLLPFRAADIVHLRFPVPHVDCNKKQPGDTMNIIFIGRQEAAKGYPLVPLIAKKIQSVNTTVHWHIVGTSATDSVEVIWDENIPVTFYGNLANDAVLELLKSMQILILPSLAEGTPVTVIEAMKAGVVPVVNNIEGGIQELVIDNETGYKIQSNSIDAYVEKILALIDDKDRIRRMSIKSSSMVNELFDPVINTKAIEEKIITLNATKRKIKSAIKVYGSRLDRSWIPNSIVKAIR